MPSLLSEFWQYLKDAAPGGSLNPETPKLGGLLNKGANELAASLREYGKANMKPGAELERGAATPAAMGAALGAGLLGAGGVAAYEKPGLLRDLLSGVPPEPEQQNWLQRMLIPQTHSRPGGVRG